MMMLMPREILINLSYTLAAGLFILGLKLLGRPSTARRGNTLSALGMLLAVVVTLLDQAIIDYRWIMLGILIGTMIGTLAARMVAMTAMPQMVALLNGFGGIASLLLGWVALARPQLNSFNLLTIFLSILIGGVTFTGSLVAWGKLSGRINSRPMVFRGQRGVNVALLLTNLACGAMFALFPAEPLWLYLVTLLAATLGVMTVIPIGGANMPVVISLLNSYSGLAACAAGFAINNNILIVAGSLVGASGIVLTKIMCKSLNRSLAKVLFSGFAPVSNVVDQLKGESKSLTAEDAYFILEAAQSVVIIPGYGMAVAQAQYVVKELQGWLEKNDCEVVYAIHPVAGRMPGHMNVLLAEADVSYDLLVEMDAINPRMETFDVAIVIGANDVVNTAAREVEDCPIYGMPIINADHARTVLVLKRSLAAGFAGFDNPLFYKDNTRMIFGDAKETVTRLVREFST
jgi:NAD(P) transhydrogenase subunit beta